MDFDVIIIGSGPGGYVTAIRSAQLGFNTAIIEKESLGGVCLNWGCIPTKALLKSAQVFEYINESENYGINVEKSSVDFSSVINRSRKVAEGMSGGINYLMKKNKIKVINGFGKIKKENIVEVNFDGNISQYSGKNIIIATGGRSRQIPNLKQDGKKIIGYRDAMVLKEKPKKMVIIGSGAIGVEFAYFYNSMGTDVTIVDICLISSLEDKDISKQLTNHLKNLV